MRVVVFVGSPVEADDKEVSCLFDSDYDSDPPLSCIYYLYLCLIKITATRVGSHKVLKATCINVIIGNKFVNNN